MAVKTTKRRMSKKDQEDWDALYQYVHTDVMGYDENQMLSKNMVLRLKGMQNGKFIANNNIKDMSDYSFETILNTFKYCYLDIQKAIRTVDFKDESHKFNYIMRIVEDNLNEVYMRAKNMVKAEEKSKSIDMEICNNSGAEYQTNRKKVSKRLKGLW